MPSYRIGDITKMLGLSADTLRYYEKLGLLKNVSRTESNIRQYSEKNISALKFIQRAQKMNFKLSEISDLLSMRDDPQHARDTVRQLTAEKLGEIENQLKDLTTLKTELTLLLNLCRGSKDGCPIIEGIDEEQSE